VGGEEGGGEVVSEVSVFLLEGCVRCLLTDVEN